MSALLPDGATRIGVAVSGGSDSTALLHLAHDWCRETEADLHVATVDHGLRPEAKAEAAHVRAMATTLARPHDTLTWPGWTGDGNLQAEARAARYRLLAEWARDRRLESVLLGHTQNDTAETLLMGLSRGAGLDGLSAMAPGFTRDGGRFLRPLLDAKRDDLRAFLTATGITWIDDPSNDEEDFLRVRLRRAMGVLAEAGIDSDRLARSAWALRQTRDSLDAMVAEFTRTHIRFDRGDLVIAADAFAEAPEEICRRILARSLRAISGRDYPPRAGKILNLTRPGTDRGGQTLHGCLIRSDTKGLRITREPEAAHRASPVKPGEIWDGRWHVTGPSDTGEVRATGRAGLSQCPAWRATGLPRASLLSAPAIWQGDTLIAAPIAGLGSDWQVTCDVPFTANGFWR